MKNVPLPGAPFAEGIDYYLALRRQLGFCLEREGAQLLSLAFMHK